MSETRDPALGEWCIFEGNTPKTDRRGPIHIRGDVNEPIEWPVTLRVFHIRAGVLRSRDVSVDEGLNVTVGDREEVGFRGVE